MFAAVAYVLLFVATGTLVETDGNGFFVGKDGAAPDEAHAGAGVKFVVVDPAKKRLVGLLNPRAADPSIWTRAADGTLIPTRLAATTAAAPLRADVVAAALAAWGAATSGDTWRSFAACCGAKSDRPEEPQAPDAPDGEELEISVRFRSVEAAYRFASAADDLAAALLVSEEEDARDYGTLRLVLHDLLLPTIWRTNPDVTRGVGGVDVTIAPPFVRGRLRVAATFQIVNGELHRMQTEAGIAEEATPGHLWRPADDPFPGERERLNFRKLVVPGAFDIDARGGRVVATGIPVEVVATDRALGERVAARAAAAGGATLERPEGVSALFATNPLALPALQKTAPRTTRSGPRETREITGLARLAEGRLGRVEPPARLDARARGPAAALAAVESVYVTTDAKGARITVRCADENSAGRFAGALRDLADAGPTADRACLHNLADLAPLALVENPQDDVAERNFVVLGWKPACPCGGTYSVHPITRAPVCSVHGTVKSPKSGTWKPPAVSEVRADGRELSFRLGIDWNRKE